MANNLKGDFIDKVSDKCGYVRITTSSQVAVATAVDTMIREVTVQACNSNTSAVRVRLGEVCTSTTGIQMGQAISTVALTAMPNCTIQWGLASLTLINVYSGVDAEAVDVIWRN